MLSFINPQNTLNCDERITARIENNLLTIHSFLKAYYWKCYRLVVWRIAQSFTSNVNKTKSLLMAMSCLEQMIIRIYT